MREAPQGRNGERRLAFVWVNDKAFDEAEGAARTLPANQRMAHRERGALHAAHPVRNRLLEPAQAFAHKRALADGGFAYFIPSPDTPTGT